MSGGRDIFETALQERRERSQPAGEERGEKHAKSKHWIQGAVKRPGQLHRDLGVPQGQKIPAAKLQAALHSPDPKVRQRARFAENVR